jgi:hypothetical protein
MQGQFGSNCYKSSSAPENRVSHSLWSFLAASTVLSSSTRSYTSLRSACCNWVPPSSTRCLTISLACKAYQTPPFFSWLCGLQRRALRSLSTTVFLASWSLTCTAFFTCISAPLMNLALRTFFRLGVATMSVFACL